MAPAEQGAPEPPVVQEASVRTRLARLWAKAESETMVHTPRSLRTITAAVAAAELVSTTAGNPTRLAVPAAGVAAALGQPIGTTGALPPDKTELPILVVVVAAAARATPKGFRAAEPASNVLPAAWVAAELSSSVLARPQQSILNRRRRPGARGRPQHSPRPQVHRSARHCHINGKKRNPPTHRRGLRSPEQRARRTPREARPSQRTMAISTASLSRRRLTTCLRQPRLRLQFSA